MKKQYINPSMEVVEIKAQQLLAGSDPTLSGTLDSTDPILSRELEGFESLNDSESLNTGF
jgi:hypothetical protein